MLGIIMVVWKLCPQNFLLRYFDHIYASCDMKAYKPDASFFTTILEAEGIRPEDAVFVDDSQKNVAGANSLGIHGICAPDGLTANLAENLVESN